MEVFSSLVIKKFRHKQFSGGIKRFRIILLFYYKNLL